MTSSPDVVQGLDSISNPEVRLVATRFTRYLVDEDGRSHPAQTLASDAEQLLAFVLDALRTSALDRTTMTALQDYARANGPWTGSATQVQNKVSGLAHLVAGTPEYQFV